MRQPQHSRFAILSAFAAIYFIWGSVYLAVQFAVTTLPPFLMVGVRMAFAGLLLHACARGKGAARPQALHWRTASVIGFLVVVMGSAAVAWAQKRGVPSGLTALLIATETFWIILLDWLLHKGHRPGPRVVVGMLLGFAGVALLVAPGRLDGSVDPLGAGVILVGTVAWAGGSLYSRSAPQPASLLLSIGMQMFVGGALAMVVGSLLGEWARVDLAAVTPASWLAFAYLLIFATLITFPAYIWLLRVVPAARVSTYAYVNPVVALLLGWLIAGEPLGIRSLVAAALIVVSVLMVVTRGAAPAAAAPSGEH
jgi:drug/metabolite transporter (DMT)-like permease